MGESCTLIVKSVLVGCRSTNLATAGRKSQSPTLEIREGSEYCLRALRAQSFVGAAIP